MSMTSSIAGFLLFFLTWVRPSLPLLRVSWHAYHKYLLSPPLKLHQSSKSRALTVGVQFGLSLSLLVSTRKRWNDLPSGYVAVSDLSHYCHPLKANAERDRAHPSFGTSVMLYWGIYKERKTIPQGNKVGNKENKRTLISKAMSSKMTLELIFSFCQPVYGVHVTLTKISGYSR